MCVLSIKAPIQKKSGNLFNDPRIYIYIYMGYFFEKKQDEFLKDFFSLNVNFELFGICLLQKLF